MRRHNTPTLLALLLMTTVGSSRVETTHSRRETTSILNTILYPDSRTQIAFEHALDPDRVRVVLWTFGRQLDLYFTAGALFQRMCAFVNFAAEFGRVEGQSSKRNA